MGERLKSAGPVRAISVALADTSWHSLSDLLSAITMPSNTGPLRVRLVAPQSSTAKGSANAAVVQIGAPDLAGGGTPIATDYLPTDGTRDQWRHVSDLSQLYLKGSAGDRVELTIEFI